MRKNLGILRAFAALLLGPALADAGVIVVSSSGGGQYTNLQMAVNGAADGDTLLVKPGQYSSFTITDKSLVVVAESGTTAGVNGTVVVQSLASHRSVVLAGLSATGSNSLGTGTAAGVGLLVKWNFGSVRAVRCVFRGAPGLDSIPGTCALDGHGQGWQGAYVLENSAGVAFEDCSFVGGEGWSNFLCYYGDSPTPDGGDGLYVRDTRVAIYDGNAAGGGGGDHGWGGRGGDGARVFLVTLNTWTVASGTVFQGGTGGDSYDSVPTPVRELTSVPIAFNGPPGARVYLVTSLATGFQAIPSWKGVLLTESPTRARTMEVGTIPASGSLSISLPLGDLGPGVAAETRHMQAYLVDGNGGVQLGSFAAMTILDSNY